MTIKSPGQDTKGKILVATPASMRDVAFRCRACDFITCMECLLRAYELHDPNQGMPTCPACGEVGGPMFFTEWLGLPGKSGRRVGSTAVSRRDHGKL